VPDVVLTQADLQEIGLRRVEVPALVATGTMGLYLLTVALGFGNAIRRGD
jgi:hypothetical protein